MTAKPDASVASWLAAYEPEYAPARFGPLIRESVQRAAPATVVAARLAAGMLSGLVMWADETGLDVTAGVVFDREVIDRYVAHAMGPLGYAPASRVSAHWQLRALALANGAPPGPGERRVYRVPRPAVEPYSPAEVDGFLAWADAKRNPVHRRALLAVLAGTLGAGLTRLELAALPGVAITGAASGTVRVAVRAGAHPRVVTALDRYAGLLLDAGRHAGREWVVRPDMSGTETRVTTAVNTMTRDPRLPVLTVSRCRSTWVCGHLTAGTRLDVLVEAGGFAGPEGLAGFLSVLPERAPDLDFGLLRRPRRGQPRPRVPALHPGSPS